MAANLGELVERADTETHLVLTIPKTREPVKPYELRECGALPDGTMVYEVPASYIYAYYMAVLADGSALTCMRRKDVPYATQLALYEASVAAGLNVKALKPEKVKGKKGTGLTLESLMGFKPKAGGKGKTVTNAL